MLGFIAGIIPFLIIISVIVSFHEWGHFAVARLFRTRIERFSVGMGKVLLRHKDKSGVEWCLSALPVGGYVKFAGDDNLTSMSPSAEDLDAAREAITAREGATAVGDYFHFKPLWQRFLIILAGPAANFVLAIAIFTVINLVVGDTRVPATVTRIEPGSAAATAGFQVGDTILRIDGHGVDDNEDARMLIMLRADTPVKIVIDRNHQDVTLTATPRRVVLDPTGRDATSTGGQLGVELSGPPVSVRLGPVKAFELGVRRTWEIVDTNLTYISRIFTGKENGNQIGGLIGMTKVAGDATVDLAEAQAPVYVKLINGALVAAQMTALISVAIGFVNLLPIPPLDGGHLALYLYQGLTRRTVSAGFQNAVFRIAIVLVIGLMLFAAWNDLNHIGLARFFGGLFS
ncbi:RIP metalloprotease [Asticcacaulis sp. EMRT-3]|uniref:M50 family metallopeptidase n=1 Tax=Asticcacaulis sp. EMRT-3 TaxID=3040349 RepID=UPI0024AF05E1|nr:RIP metalloprotease [Asticcacaulis sp. EMRT-3]MDI7774842.1 RIP metalloprotease [Asticcacaulis sp. EMRT-3]